MNKKDLIQFELFCRDLYRREAKARARRYPEAAEHLNKLADQSEARAEEVRCGPLLGVGQ
jgi:hypothetical protein